MDRPNALEAYSMVLLTNDGRFLLLERSAAKRFAPGKWTGLGGRVETGELDDVKASALRELAEEAELTSAGIAHLALRRVLLHARPGEPLTLLLYFTGETEQPVAPSSPEGTLHWIEPAQLGGLDLIDDAALVIPLLIEDLRRDREAREPVRLGAAVYAPDGGVWAIAWA